MFKSQGLTLIELLVAISVLAIVTTLGVPSFRYFIETQHQDTAREKLVDSLHLSRLQAQRLKTNVYLCATDNGTSCGNDWSKGWMAYADKDRSNSLNAGDEIFLVYRGLQVEAITAGSNSLLFSPSGMMQSETFDICSSFLAKKNSVDINSLGYINLGQSNANHC